MLWVCIHCAGPRRCSLADAQAGEGMPSWSRARAPLVAAPQVLPLELGGRVTAAGPLYVARANARKPYP